MEILALLFALLVGFAIGALAMFSTMIWFITEGIKRGEIDIKDKTGKWSGGDHPSNEGYTVKAYPTKGIDVDSVALAMRKVMNAGL